MDICAIMRTPGMHDGTPHACTTKWTPPMQTLAPDPARDGGSITLLNSLPLDVGGWVWDLQADEPPIDHLEVHKTGLMPKIEHICPYKAINT